MDWWPGGPGEEPTPAPTPTPQDAPASPSGSPFLDALMGAVPTGVGDALTTAWRGAFPAAPEVFPDAPPGYPQPSLEQIQAETDTLNGRAPPAYSPAFGSFSRGEIEDALSTYGWRPEAAATFARDVPVRVEQMPDEVGGQYHPNDAGGPDRPSVSRFVGVNGEWARDEEGRANVPWVIQHEAQHDLDDPRFVVPPGDWVRGVRARARNAWPDASALHEIAALSVNPDYPVAAGAARAVLHGPIGRGAGPGGVPTSPYARGDYTHLFHELMDGLDYDYGQLPPEVLARRFPFANPTTAPITLERAMQTESSQLARAHEAPVWTDELASYDPWLARNRGVR